MIFRERNIIFLGKLLKIKIKKCDSVLFSYKMLIGIWVISIDRICTILEN